MRVFAGIYAIAARVADILGIAGMIVMVLMAFHVFLNISARWISGKDLDLTLEIVTYYYMVAITFLPLAYVDRMGEHIRADLLTQFLSRGVIEWSDVFFRFALAALLAVLTWKTFESALDQTEIRETINTGTGVVEIWVSRWSLPIGMGAAGFYAAILGIKQAAAALSEPART